jgi:1-acyl-sn-glycerol-3-phosphate acyltransferase
VFYQLTKIYARLALKVYCRKVIINKPELLKSRGPILLAANHPNSFLDGIILTTLFDQPVHSLARGDAFKNKWINRFLRSIQLLPVYRTSEGTENLSHNYTTFAACQETFKEKGIVLIFSEGRCENEWHLRPLKKGTARLATTAWENSIPLQVLPVGLNYSSFKRFGKEVHIYFGEPITREDIDPAAAIGKKLVDFNALLQNQLQQLVYELNENDKEKLYDVFPGRVGVFKYLLVLPAIAGWILHAPLFYLCKGYTQLYFKKSGHYDSVLTSLLLLFYPIYFLIVACLFFIWQPVYGWLAILLLPVTAWALVQLKDYME